MKASASVIFVIAALLQINGVQAAEVTPIEKVIAMISDLETKILGEGTDAQKVYDEYAEFCEDRSTNLGFEIKTGKENVAELSATIEEETSTMGALETKIEELSSAISSDEADLS